ncbi:MAG: cytochrome P450 [Pseudomonadota bacterium]
MAKHVYTPPHPRPLGELAALVRTAREGEGNLLGLLPREVYSAAQMNIGYSRRQIHIVNDPQLVRELMTSRADAFPKSDLMVGALAPLVGNSLFVSHGDIWRRQRRMIDPSFSHMHVSRAFSAMQGAVDDYEALLGQRAAGGESFSLDMAMSHLTADIITRTIFSKSLESDMARDVFQSFMRFERSAAHVELRRLIFGRAWAPVQNPPHVLEACERIRTHLGTLLDDHMRGDKADIARSVIEAADPKDGSHFTREELIDELGVFFLAGHETTASVLTWVIYILAQNPDVVDRLRAEIEAHIGDGPITFDGVKKLSFIRNVFKETLRLYPPITFIPRVASERSKIGSAWVKKGAMIMIAPWVMHRHQDYWREPHSFDPDRFSPDREHELTPHAYLPFGQGQRICVGAGFATMESALILAQLVRRFDFEVMNPDQVKPVARLTTRPKEQIMIRVRDCARTAPRETKQASLSPVS